MKLLNCIKCKMKPTVSEKINGNCRSFRLFSDKDKRKFSSYEIKCKCTSLTSDNKNEIIELWNMKNTSTEEW